MRKKNGFSCLNCHKWVFSDKLIGTQQRNHCPYCLWSMHVDLAKPGDRKSACNSAMQPLGLSFKQEGINTYGQVRQGELMLIHQCLNPKCQKISINRIAADDNCKSILNIFEQSLNQPNSLKKSLARLGIRLLSEKDRAEIAVQLFGKSD